jgi:hypothetical protein
MTNIQKGRPDSGNNFQRVTIDLEEESVTFNSESSSEMELRAVNRLLNIGFLLINTSMEMEEEGHMAAPKEKNTEKEFTEAANEWASRQANGEARGTVMKDNVTGPTEMRKIKDLGYGPAPIPGRFGPMSLPRNTSRSSD